MKEFQPAYYQMCKSSKIQDLWKAEIGDYCFIYENCSLLIKDVACYPNVDLVDLQFISGNFSFKDSVNWLPLQHQLYNVLLSNDKSERNIWSWSRRFTEFCNSFELAHQYRTDWEICWLAFIEHYLWNREWESGEWIEKNFDNWLQQG
ncbi:hypothetical protein LCGC14_0883470 [marine sediment metagenome]|uniref:Uncharacterized protein n=1 Tax=marine sediment metagenome TaxID=412755 RepID=A0A0F9S874_9ZZZZ